MADTSLERQYGSGFPKPDQWKDGKAWLKWADAQRKAQETVMRDKRLYWARHRHFRAGHQWISTRDGKLWRETSADVNDIRIVENIIGPALDFRCAIISEQKPGFRHEPIGGGTAARESAEAQQATAEYYFYFLRAWLVFLDAYYNAQTDGVAFVQVYIDPTGGTSRADTELVPPSDTRYEGLKAQGYEVREDGLVVLPFVDGKPAAVGTEPELLFTGEIAHRVVLAHETILDPEARTVNGPVDKARWAIIRRLRPVESARLEVGDSKLEADQMLQSDSDTFDMPMDRGGEYQRGLPPFPTRRQRLKEGIFEHIIYITPAPHIKALNKGICVKIIGDKIVYQKDELPGGVIPLARFTDGSSDPEMYPRPIMSDWMGNQVSINALSSLLMKHTRWFSGGRVLAAKNTLLEETYTNIVGSLVEYQGVKPDVLQPVAAGSDAWRLLDLMIKKLEDKAGYNDIARGQVSGTGSLQDVSGRALLGARELFERVFGPPVRATAEGATEWSRLIIEYAKFIFDEPRMIPVVSGRGDLAKRIDRETLGDRVMVYADPETMMPLPRAMRQQLLFEQYKEGMISLATYQKRAPYAEIRNVHMGESDQWDRAQWINTILEERWKDLALLPPSELYAPENTAILWQDEPAAHKVALNEIILDERRPWPLRKLAIDRFSIYEQLEIAKLDPTMMFPVPPEVLGGPVARSIQPALPPEQEQSGDGSNQAPGTFPEGVGLAAPEIGNTQSAQQIPLGSFGDIERAGQEPVS